MKHETKVEQVKVSYTCDICGVHSTGRGCSICGRHVCDKHTKYDPTDYGDYPDSFCTECWSEGSEIWSEIHSLCERCQYDEREALYAKWRKDRRAKFGGGQ